jgi:hypothetical protein
VEVADKDSQERGSKERLKYILGLIHDIDPSLKVELEKFSVGNTRCLTDWQQFCGVDLKYCSIEPRAKLGGLSKELFLDYLLELISQVKMT